MKKMLMWCREMLIPRRQGKKQIARDMGITLGLLAAAAILSAMLMCFEASAIYRDMAQANVPSEYVSHPDRKRGIFVRIADAFLTPTFLLLVILFVVVTLKDL